MAKPTGNLEEILDMEHLAPDSEEELLSSAEGPSIEDHGTAEIAGPEKDPREEEEYTFHFTYEGPRKKYEGKFTNHILSVGEQGRAGIAEAKINGHVPYAAMPPDQLVVSRALAHLSLSLDRKTRPEWAKDLFKLLDENVVLALYAEVSAHEAIFRGITPDSETSEDEGGEQ